MAISSKQESHIEQNIVTQLGITGISQAHFQIRLPVPAFLEAYARVKRCEFPVSRSPNPARKPLPERALKRSPGMNFGAQLTPIRGTRAQKEKAAPLSYRAH